MRSRFSIQQIENQDPKRYKNDAVGEHTNENYLKMTKELNCNNGVRHVENR